MKTLKYSQRSDFPHWVGDGFPVRSAFSYHQIKPQYISPFLLMDYAGPAEFPPTTESKGVGEHPHRGFETVTLVYSGQVEHRDSAGGGGIIGAGDVQWMTAASGLVHEEKHGRDFARTGGKFEMVQLWVNLPAQYKMSPPRYQGIRDQEISRVELPNQAGTVRVIAGDFQGTKGAAQTFTAVNLWDIQVNKESLSEFKVPAGHTAAIFVLNGKVQILGGKDEDILSEAELGLLSTEEDVFKIKALEPAKILFLGGEPIREPVVGYGPFVMNTPQEIRQAMEDYEMGRMGHLS